MKNFNYIMIAALAVSSPTFADTASNVERSYKESKATTKEVITDSMITVKIKELFLQEPDISSRKIHVTTKHGIVTLVGKVNSEYERNLAIDLAMDVDGVKDVHHNRLTTPS